MTSRNEKSDHKICGVPPETCRSVLTGDRPPLRAGERGYTLVALLAVMTLMTLFALAAAPSILQQAQREREKEAIFRGEEVAEAIRIYYGAHRVPGEAGLPTSIDDLLQGVAKPGVTKKLQVLRASAARDPLSSSGEWRLVRPHSGAMAEFTRSLMLYTDNVQPNTFDPQLKSQQPFWAPLVPSLGGLTGSTLSGDEVLDSSTGPFIGVSSRSKQNSVISYYGIAQHNQWVFTPFFR